MIRFHLSCVPPKTNHHAKSIVRVQGFARLADKPELVAAKAMLDELLLPHQPPVALDGPVSLSLVITWPWRKTELKSNLKLGRIPHVSKPDCDNVAKSITDRLAALQFIECDQRIVDLHVTKWWGDRPGIDVSIARLTGDSLDFRSESAAHAAERL